jgi:hypothetical protein
VRDHVPTKTVAKLNKRRLYAGNINVLARFKAYGLMRPTAEFYFHLTRMWRFDFAYPKIKLAIEVDGGIWIMGRHNRASGWLRDQEKFNEAAILGWSVMRFTPQQIEDGSAFVTIQRAIEVRKAAMGLAPTADTWEGPQDATSY